MKIVNIIGGLGNQLFQYAFYLNLIKYHKNVYVDLKEFENYGLHNGYEIKSVFDINLPKANSFKRNLFIRKRKDIGFRILRKLYKTKNKYIFESPQFVYQENLINNKEPAYLWGYWQHKLYVENVEKELRQALIFPQLTDSKNKALYKFLIEQGNTVSVHIRRGDYIDHPTLGGICNKRYFQNAIIESKLRIKKPKFIFFSNDIKWCKENFLHEEAIFVDWNNCSQSYIDMQLMSKCKHHIISNSSFSWWAAWLNNSPEKIVIAPKTWINHPQGDSHALLLNEFILM